MLDIYKKDDIDAVNAKFEAQKIAFAPLTFQAARAMRDLHILEAISDARKCGITISALSQKLNISVYGVSVLVEIGLGMGAIKLHKNSNENDLKLVLGKIGFFLLKDDMTNINMDFVQDICYKGANDLKESICNSKPLGLKHLGNWNTIYHGLSELTEQQKKSWFGFDHFYSDNAFNEALPIVFSKSCNTLFDIGGNTAKFAIECCKYNANVNVTIIDLPGQTKVAKQNVKKANFENRISTFDCDILSEKATIPTGANAIWMSQFLDCFSLSQVTDVLTKVHAAANENTNIYVLEPLWDKQRFEAAAYSLMATSLYFTCMANCKSKMYRYKELVCAIENAGFELREAHHGLGVNNYSLLRFVVKK